MKIPISKFMADRGLSQAEAALIVGVTQGAISKAVLAERDVYVVVDASGKVIDAEEVVKFGRGRRDSSAASGEAPAKSKKRVA
jgi:predicted transcriptional regulator